MPSGYCNVPGCRLLDGRWQENVRLIYPVPSVRVNGYGADGSKKELSRSASRSLRLIQWLQACGLDSPGVNKVKKVFVCSKHFVSGKPSCPNDENSVDWVPSLFLPNRSMSGDDEQLSPNYELNTCDFSEDEIEMPETASKSVKENDSFRKGNDDLENKCEILEDKCESLVENCCSLKEDFEKLPALFHKRTISEEFCVVDNDKTRYLTGFPTQELMMLMFRDCKPFITNSKLSALSKFQKYVLTLMRLRLNVEFRFLAYYFSVSDPTATRAFYEVLPVMSVRFASLIFWPSREKRYENVPLQFRESFFGRKVAVIVDCFEIGMERPSNTLAGSQVYSHYKHEIDVSPQGAIVFISKGYGGRSSDKYITKDSDFLKNLRPGDVVLADRGFLVHDSVRLVRAEIHRPAFKQRGAQQMDPRDIEESRRVSRRRIHVERVVGYLRSHFKVLSGTFPIEFFHTVAGERPVVDQIVYICCAITNLYPTVVPEV